MNNIRVEDWCGYTIRFVEVNGEWYAILKDICDALNLRTKDVSKRIGSEMLERVRIEVSMDSLTEFSFRYEHKPVTTLNNDILGKELGRTPGENRTRWMLAVNEQGIYQALFASRKLEAQKFQRWTFEVLKKLRKSVGLAGYEVMRMTEPDIQSRIDWILDGLYYDDTTGKVMLSVTVQGGDVDQIPLDEYRVH